MSTGYSAPTQQRKHLSRKVRIARISRLLAEDRVLARRKKLLLGALLIVLLGVSMCITNTSPMFVSPIEVAQCIGIRLQQAWLAIVDPAQAPRSADIVAEHPLYYWTMTNIGLTFVYALCGIMLALSGALFQNVFRNPIASPSMLGVSSGVQLGVGVLVFVYGSMAASMVAERYVFSYVAVAIVFVLLFGLSWLMGGKRRGVNVMNMLVVGVIINQFVGVGITYLTWYVFDDEIYYLFASLSTMVIPDNTATSWLFLAIGFGIGVLPVVAMRFRMNSLTFTPAEMRMLGVNSTRLQAVALLCATVAMVTAQLQVGAVAMITLVVPHLSRTIFGAEFRKQLTGTALIGASVLVGCHIISKAIPYTGEIPVGVVINLVLLPLFCWMMATQQRKWD